MRTLVIGGTRNLGPLLVARLLARGDSVAVLNRGQTPDDLPAGVERLCADRTDASQLKSALAGRDFDLVVDTTLYNGAEASTTIDLLDGRVGHYIFVSSGQVYLIRVGPERPFRESDYDGPLMAAPPPDHPDYHDWLYGDGKRAAEDALARAWDERRFPFTTLRLPMVNSPRDHYHRIEGYLLRLRDGGPILAPEPPDLPLRHVYGDDVIQAILRVSGKPRQMGLAYNVGQDEPASLQEFLAMLAEMAGAKLRLVRVPRQRLRERNLMPFCSPFSDAWMSALDNTRSKQEFGMRYTALPVYLQKLVEHFMSQPPRCDLPQYARRAEELQLADAATLTAERER